MSRLHGQFWTVIGGAVLLLPLAHRDALAQDPLENAPLTPGSAMKEATSDKSEAGTTNKTDAKEKAKPKSEFIVKSPAEWSRILTRLQFAVARAKATEPAFSGKYASGHFRGTFVCVCCDAAHVTSELFSSRTKFESGTGWPSFYQPFDNKAIQTAWDYSEVEPRVEVMCRRCGAHLGHVFEDGPPPTGLRFCINSASIKLIALEAEAGLKNSADKTSSKSKSKAKQRTSAKSAPKRSQSNDGTAPADSSSGHAADKAGSGTTSQTSGL
jgi:peptide-methionine (R)-S-oxide reductase